jgi:hypothetical protein
VLTSKSGTPHYDSRPRRGLSGRTGENIVAVYCAESDLPTSTFTDTDFSHFVRCSAWQEFERASRDASCGITVLPDLEKNPHTSQLVELKRKRPTQPIVLVTRPDFANVIHVRYLPVEEVLPLGCPASLLASTVGKVIGGTAYRQIEWRIRNASMPEQLRRALLHLWNATPCVVSVDKLALRIGCGRSTLYETWTSTFGGHPPRSVKEVIGWIVLVRMVQLRDAGYSWKRVERTLGIGASTLDRTASRLLKQSRASLSCNRVTVLSRFEDEVLRSILDGDDSAVRQHGARTVCGLSEHSASLGPGT